MNKSHKSITIVQLTELNELELEELSQLLIAVVEDGASVGFLPPLSHEDAANYWRTVLGTGTFLWAAYLKDELIGTVQLHLTMKPNGMHRAEIAKLLVRPDQRRKGVARQLMNTAHEQAAAENRNLLVLDTREGDPSNLLYQSLGYLEAGRIPHFAMSADGELETTVIYYRYTHKI